MKYYPRPTGEIAGTDLPKKGVNTGSNGDTYGGGWDKGHQGGESISDATGSDPAWENDWSKNKRSK